MRANVVIDVAAAVIAWWAAGTASSTSLLAASLLLLARTGGGLFRHRTVLSVLVELPAVVRSSTLAFGVFCVAAFTLGTRPDFGAWIVYFAVFSFAATLARTVFYAGVRRHRRSSPDRRRRTLILGAGVVGEEIARTLLEHSELGLEPVAFLDVDAQPSRERPLEVLETQDSLRRLLEDQEINTMVIAYGTLPESQVVDDVIEAVRAGCQLMVVPRLFELQREGPDTEWVNGIPLVRLRTDVTSSPSWWVKRAVDRTVAALAVLALSPLLLALAVGVVLDSGRPVLFRQERVGVDNRPIRVLKFRSLRPADETESRTNWNIKGDPRLTRFGAFLRRTSLDELPQLLNILRGDMSLVGPRPERPVFVEKFSGDHPRYWARHRVPVGLTGWSQVNGLRGDTSIAQRARFDNFYIANWSLWLDAKIVFLTVREVLRGSGG